MTSDDFYFWVALTAKALRETAGASIQDVATVVGVEPNVVYRFEREGRWPSRTGPTRLMSAYAHFAGLGDARDVYEAAMKRWRSEGVAPELPVGFDEAVRLLKLRSTDARTPAEGVRAGRRQFAQDRPPAPRTAASGRSRKR